MIRLTAARTPRVTARRLLAQGKRLGCPPRYGSGSTLCQVTCPRCGALVRRVSAHRAGGREVVAGWSNVRCATTHVASTAERLVCHLTECADGLGTRRRICGGRWVWRRYRPRVG